MVQALKADAFLTSLDSLIRPICTKLQLPLSSHEIVDSRYQAVGEWLDECATLSKYKLRIFPQGSYAIGTTVRPYDKNEFDLDFVLLLQENYHSIEPILLLNTVESRLLYHGKYANMIERKNRCIRITYANDFHMDILPAIPDNLGHSGYLSVPDGKAQDWKPSCPEGFRDWFNFNPQVNLDFRQQAPLPNYQTLEEKSTLQCNKALPCRFG
ncbi:nucleotidyltransferase domain-containing protein [Anthocerotibacter panamensis]|uniref:nucleotidyltransferase domain-containing protein n=1 Tax=Anthocerotibacter panamensis TaxID=2857077 RepID=UPI001C406C9F|nr:nucleotidyltransferase [Anthocerotibacter panamensis]